MKKLLLGVLFALVLFVCSFNSVITINATQTDEMLILPSELFSQYLNEALDPNVTYDSGLNEYDDFKTAYFDNLTYNFGMNYKGSCGYVALGMLLSYYDIFLNDSIVPEQYDVSSVGTGNNMIERRNSPGIVRDFIFDPVTQSYLYGKILSANEYYSHITSISNSSLHAKLITIGASIGYYNFNSDSSSCGLSFSQIKDITNEYLKGFNNFTASDYSLKTPSEGENVRNFTISQIQAGNPVLLAASRYDGGHAFIAYDYDAENDDIYCHYGWGANTTHDTPESRFFNNYLNAFSIEWNISHSHSNNFGVLSIIGDLPNVDYYCYDNNSIISVHSQHSYINELYNTQQHKRICECGTHYFQNHSLTYRGTSGRKHIVSCNECPYSITENCLGATVYDGVVRCIKCGKLLGVNLFGSSADLFQQMFANVFSSED